jgi:hypothetical protein
VQLINRERAVLIDIRRAGPVRSRPRRRFAQRTAGQPRLRRPAEEQALRSWSSVRPGRAPRRRGAQELGFEMRALAGGLDAWRAANLPVEKTA